MKNKILISAIVFLWILLFSLAFFIKNNKEEVIFSNGKEKNFSGEIYVYITENGEKYHKEGCSSIKEEAKKITEEKAKYMGFDRCGRCF